MTPDAPRPVPLRALVLSLASLAVPVAAVLAMVGTPFWLWCLAAGGGPWQGTDAVHARDVAS